MLQTGNEERAVLNGPDATVFSFDGNQASCCASNFEEIVRAAPPPIRSAQTLGKGTSLSQTMYPSIAPNGTGRLATPGRVEAQK